MKRTFNLFSLAMVLALIASLLGIPPIPAYSESTIEHATLSLPSGWREGHLYGVWGSSASDVYAVGHATDTFGNHVPLVYHNDGTAWTEASPSLPAGWSGAHLYGVWGSSAADVYAVGEGDGPGGALVYHNDGTGWTETALSLPVGWTRGILTGVWGSSASDVYAVGWGSGPGGYNMPLLYHNDGTGWSEASSSLPAGGGYLNGVWGSSTSDVYAVGWNGNGSLLYHNDGTGWSEASSSLPAGGGNLYGVWGSSTSDVYAVGWSSNGILLYHNDGTGWSEASLSLPTGWSGGYLLDVWGSSANDVYAVGYGVNALGRSVPLLYYNDGTGWNEANLSLPTGLSDGYLHAVWGSSAGDLYIVGEGFNANDGYLPLLYQRGADNETPLIRYVKWNASGANNGASWTDAYTDLQSALADAISGDEIWVAAGTYKPTASTDRTISFALKNGVAVYGGFAGTETLLTQRNPATNITILSGDIGVIGDNSDNSYHVVIGSNTNNSAILDGFTVTSGNANSNSYASNQSKGGGMYTDPGSPTVMNVIFISNYGTFGGGMYNGGEYSYPNGSGPILTNLTFSNNSAIEGGGIRNENYSNPSLTNVTFSGNTAVRSGGGMENFYYSSPTLTNVTFNNNTTGAGGGGIMNWSSSSPILTNVTFNANSATDWGGGIYNDNGSNPSLKNVTFNSNQAPEGGGMYNAYGSDPTITNSILYGNTGGDIFDVSGTRVVTYSIVQGGYPGTGNLDANPLLGPLSDNGGFTQTMALGAGSPAIDAGDDTNCPPTDQRGVARPQGSGCDIGAYEAYDGTISPGDTVRVSVNSAGAQVNNGSGSSSISADGRYVAFISNATDLVSDDTNGWTDIFVHDMQMGVTTRVSVDSNGVQANTDSWDSSISGEGQYIAFMSLASNLVPGDTNGEVDIFVHDMQTGMTKRVSVNSNGVQANDRSIDAVISADGRYVAFQSSASNLVPGDTNGEVDIFVHDMQTGMTKRVSVDSNGIPANSSSSLPAISADGRYVTFDSSATNLVPNDINVVSDIFVHDMQTGITTRLSVDSNGAQANDQSGEPSISGDGRYIAFVSPATNLVPGDTNGVYDIFMHDTQTGITTRVSVDSNGGQANSNSYRSSISADGRYVGFESSATNLVPGDTNGNYDVFAHDMQTGETRLVSVNSKGVQANARSGEPSFSADGRYIEFSSYATNLVHGDTNAASDIFVHRQDILPIPPTSTPTITPTDTAMATPTFTPTFTPTATPTVSPTPVTSCDQITPGSITKSGNSMSMTITNPLTIPIQIQDIFMIWNHDKGHMEGGDKTLQLNSVSLGSQLWNGTSNGPSITIIPSSIAYIPTGTSTITFTFHQSYDIFDGTEQIIINLTTNGCQSYPIVSTSTATSTPTYTPTNTLTPTPISTFTPTYTPTPIMYTISGNVGIGGATLNYVDVTSKTATADSNGNYSFQVTSGWSGTVTPAKTGATFTPANKTYIDVLANHTGSNYVANITVITTVDGGAGSLRQAINDAVSGATIHFDPALAGQTINLVSTLAFTKDLKIDGSGLSPRVEINGGGAVRIFDFGRSGGNATLQSLVLKNGNVTGTNNGGALIVRGGVITIGDVSFVGNSAYDGGAIYSALYNVDLRISQSEFNSNSARHYGGAVFMQYSKLTLQNNTLNNNVAASLGGAIITQQGGPFLFENNSFVANTATDSGGAIILMSRQDSVVIRGNLFYRNNATLHYGGAIFDSLPFSSVSLAIENNTFHNNSADNAGAVLVSHTVLLKNNTFSGNKATQAPVSTTAASIYLSKPLDATLINNVLANNTGGNECILNGSGVTSITGSNNLVEDGSGPCSTLPGTIISDPSLGVLMNNGGSTQTMALLVGSPAIDAGDNANCPVADQRGITRPQGNGCDLGAYEYVPPATPTPTTTFTPTATPPYSYNPLYLSLSGNQTIGGVASADEDILRFDGTNWSLFFDGSDVGVGGSDLFGFSFLDADSLLLSFTTALTLNGISVTPQDVVRFDATSLGSNTAGTFSMYFDGSDVGFDTTAENIDSVSLLPDGRVLISTTGNPVVVGVTGAKDEDVLAFTPTTLGNNTSGSWAMYFDGSDVGLAETSAEDIDALDVTSNGKVYLSTSGDFSVTGVSGADEDVFVCVPTSLGDVTACNYAPALYFDGSTWNLSANDVDAFNFLSTGPVSTNTPSITPSVTPTPSRTLTPTISVTPTRTPTPTATSTRTATSTVGSSPTNTSTPTNTPNVSDLIFANGFESGNLSAWTSNTNDLGDLSASAASALIGAQGMQAVLDDNYTIYVTDDSPNAEPRYRARFYFDPNSIPMLSGNAHFIFKGFMGTSTEVLRMEFRQSAGLYQLRIALLDDGSTWMNSNWFTISDASHLIELDWRASSSVGVNNGGLIFWIDGIQQANLTAVDNDTRRIDRARLGALTGVDTGTRGTYYFDAFESRRQNYIGPVVSASTPTPTHTPTITPTAGGGAAHAEVYVGGLLQNTYDVSPQSSVRPGYVGLNNGPLRLISTNGVLVVASERFAYNDGSAWTSYSEIMGLPHDEVTTSYSFPWYDNVDFDSQLRFANVGNASTTVTVTVGGIIKGSYVLAPNQGQLVSYPGLDNGPVKVQSSGGVPIIASLRVAYFNGSVWTSHSELMGLPQGQLTTSYIFPWYDNVDINSQLRFGNVGSSSATVTVTVGGIVQGSYVLAPNQSQQVSYAGVNNGPVKVESTNGVSIVASERVAYFDGSAWMYHSETMGLPAALLSTNYSFPVYDNVNHNSQLSFGNMGTSSTTVSVTINGVLKGIYNLAPSQVARVSYPGVNSGSVVVQSSGGVPIIASERVAYSNGSAWTSFSELIGLPSSQLSTSYFFPWYDNVNIDTLLMFGVP